jgi:CRISPR-associated protein Csd1
MILQALYQLAERERLVEDPDFEPKPIRWLVEVAKDGRCLGVTCTDSVPFSDDAGGKPKKKPKPVPRTFTVPRDSKFNTRTAGNYAGLLLDKADYVLGVVVDEKDRTEKGMKRALVRRELFRERVRGVLAATGDEGVAAVLAFLDAVAAGDMPTVPADCGPGDLFGFVYTNDVDSLVTDREAVRAWWRRERANSGDGGPEMQCLVSGKTFSDPGLFPKIKRVPGVAGDISLVSFNQSAFLSYGLTSNENAPVSREAAEAVATGLNRLLHPAYPVPLGDPPTLPPRSFRITGDTGFCYWSAGGSGGFENELHEGMNADPTVVKAEVWNRLWNGRPPDESPQDLLPFYGLIITGQTGRAILRDWFETTLGKAQRSVAMHFRDIRIVRNAPWKKGEPPPPAISLRTLLESIAPQGDQDGIPSALAGQLVRAAMTGCLYPFSLLTRAVERARAEIGKHEWADEQRRDARAALIKAVLNRAYLPHPETGKPRQTPPPQFREVREEMDPNNNNPGYILGCLMAVLERLQQEALGDVNASVIDKYFSGASAAPKATFDRMLKNARHHAKKAEGGMVFRLESLIDELIARINVREVKGQPIGFPLTLSIEQQGLFVIGYHHMRHWLWMSKEERTGWEAANPDAARAFLWNSKREATPDHDSTPAAAAH